MAYPASTPVSPDTARTPAAARIAPQKLQRADAPTVVFISSAGHSGSTLLDMMIGNLSYAESLGELMVMPGEIALGSPCTCGASLLECPLWSRVLARWSERHGRPPADIRLGWMAHEQHAGRAFRLARAASHGWRWLQLRTGLAALGLAEPVYRRGLLQTLELYGDIAECSGKRVLVNSSKPYLVAVDHARLLGARGRVVNLVRDGRAVFASFLRHGFTPRAALQAWQHHYDRALPLFERHLAAGQLLTVRYEDLVSRPQETMARICAFLGEPIEPSVADFAAVHHNVNGNDIRFRPRHELRLDERWRRELTPPQLDFFMRHAGGTMRRMGYGGDAMPPVAPHAA